MCTASDTGDPFSLTQTLIVCIERLPLLEELIMRSVGLTQEVLSCIVTHLPQLRQLDMSLCHQSQLLLDPADWISQLLEGCPHLEGVNLSSLSAKALQLLADHPTMKFISVSGVFPESGSEYRTVQQIYRSARANGVVIEL